MMMDRSAGSSSGSGSSSSHGSGNNFLWLLKSSLPRIFSSWSMGRSTSSGNISGSIITSSSAIRTSLSTQSLSSKPKRCEYKQLAAEDEDNNNLIEDDEEEEEAVVTTAESKVVVASSSANNSSSSSSSASASKKKQSKQSTSSKNKRRFGSIDDNNSSSDSDSSDSDDDDYDSEDEEQERIDRLTCWVCERFFSSSRILERHKIRERHFCCTTCEAVFPTMMALETHQEETEHWSEEEYEEDEDGRRIESSKAIDEEDSDCGSQLDTEDEMELHRVKSRHYLKKERLFLI